MFASEVTLLIVAAAVVFAAALVSSAVGFAFSAIASAALLRVFEDPVRTVAVLVVCSIAIQAYSVWALRRSIELRQLWPFLAAGSLAVPVGVWLLTRAPAAAFGLGLGTFLIAYGIYMACRGTAPVFRGNTWCDALAGALGGLLGGLAGFPGSFVTIWCGMRGWSKERQRALYQPFILVMQLESLALLSWSSPVAVVDLQAVAVLVPAAVLAAYAGLEIFKRLSARQFTMLVHSLLVVSGIALVGVSV